MVTYLTLTVQTNNNLTSFAIALSFGVTSATVSAEHLKVVFSSGSFSAIGSSTVIYDSYPNDHSPCYNTENGCNFTIEGDCWNTPCVFHCLSDNLGGPKEYEVRDADGNVLGTSEGE